MIGWRAAGCTLVIAFLLTTAGTASATPTTTRWPCYPSASMLLIQRLLLAAVDGLECIPTAPPTLRRSDAPAPLWAVENESSTHSWSREDAVAHARAFDVLTALPDSYRPHVEAMKAANPRLRLLVYLNGTFSPRQLPNAYPDAWYARDARGRRIASAGYGNWLMDPSNVGWVADRAATCERLLTRSGYDGCFVDMLTDAPLHPGYATGLPIDDRTGHVWKAQDWLRATAAIGAAIRGHNAPAPVFANALGSGRRYFRAEAPSSQVLDSVDGAVTEAWIRTAGQPADVWRSTGDWRQDVDLLVDATRRDRTVLALTKVWVDASRSEVDRIRGYVLASFLLGTDGRHRLAFSSARGAPPTAVPWPSGLGTPTGPYRVENGLYRRDFTGGTVFVNPTDGPMLTPVPWTTSLGPVVPAHTGIIALG